MHSTGRPSSAFETGLLGFSNEYYREFTEDSSTLRAFFASVLSSGATESRGEAVRSAYADDEMDGQVGSYMLGAAKRINTGITTPLTLIRGQKTEDNAVNIHAASLFESNVQVSNAALEGEWVLCERLCSVINGDDPTLVNAGNFKTYAGQERIGLWHRYA